MLEIILIILGLIIFTCSFFLPAGKKNQSEDTTGLTEDAVREMVGREVDEAKNQIKDIVDETVTYAMEKTERSMDRLTNEKMMAVNEYSDTVLEQINKNHKEVVFLYDMLNDKHENLKSTVSEAVKTASEVKQTVKDAEITAREAESVAKEAEEKAKEVKETVKESVKDNFNEEIADFAEEPEFSPIFAEKIDLPKVEEDRLVLQEIIAPEPVPKKPGRKPKKAAEVSEETEPKKAAGKEKASLQEAVIPEEVPEVTVSLNPTGRGGRNSNERILELHKAGKSNMAIAKELGLGIGEVKLVIDLFQGI